MGRQIKLIEGYQGNSAAHLDSNRTTEMSYHPDGGMPTDSMIDSKVHLYVHTNDAHGECLVSFRELLVLSELYEFVEDNWLPPEQRLDRTLLGRIWKKLRG